MSMAKISSSQWRVNHSGELDVFEAARYFSNANENLGSTNIYNGRVMRLSLDMAIPRPSLQNHPTQIITKENKKKHKQPSSPGAKLASFLNSILNQTKKIISKSGDDTKAIEDTDQVGRRKRRSSIGYFSITGDYKTCDGSKSFYSSSSSGFRTPSQNYANANTNKSYKELKNLFNHQKKENVLKNCDDATGCVTHDYPSVEREFRKFSDADDGEDTDSSSDLFDLPNHHELVFYQAGSLPTVYRTTDKDQGIKVARPVSNKSFLGI